MHRIYTRPLWGQILRAVIIAIILGVMIWTLSSVPLWSRIHLAVGVAILVGAMTYHEVKNERHLKRLGYDVRWRWP
jgi:hypothetical protein